MKYLAAITALGLLASTAAYAQSDQSNQPKPSQQAPAAAPSGQSSSDQNTQQEPQLSQQFIRQLQRRLQQQGAYQGQPNGEWDQETTDAVEQFQQDHNIQPTGQIDGATLMALMRRQQPAEQAMQGERQEGMEGSSEANGPSVRPTTLMLHAYQHGYQQGFEQGFEAAIQQLQQQQ